MKNFNKNLIFYVYKTESSTQMTVHLPHIESSKKNVKEFEKPNFFKHVSFLRFMYLEYLRLIQFLYFKFIFRIKNKVRWEVGAGERR